MAMSSAGMWAGLTGSVVALFSATAAFAGQPQAWQMDLMPSVTPIMSEIRDFHWLVLAIITVITLFVLALLIWCAVKFNAQANPNPSTTTHHVGLEVAWTVVPILILVVISIPSMRLLYHEQTVPDNVGLTIKATGQSWSWLYEYPDHGKFSFVSNMLTDGERRPDQPRLLAVDNEVVVPVGTVVRVLVTAGADDVLHAFAVPSFGIKADAVPGRINETWFEATREGVYYGQCSELCGRNHAFMPIAVRVVPKAQFDQWADEAKKRYAEGKPPLAVAELPPLPAARVADASTETAPTTR